MLFQVFHSDNNKRLGSRFRILTQIPATVEFNEEYTVLPPANARELAFYQNGKAFQFCGAGALCIAHQLFHQENHPVPQLFNSGGLRVKLTRVLQENEQKPAVGLPLVTEQSYRTINTDKGQLFYFSELGVGFYQVFDEDQIAKFTPNYQIESNQIGNKALNTVIAAHWSDKTQRIVFRYFTQFNNKGEDQATGSVFRYLSVLPLAKEIWYHVQQASHHGAEMKCKLTTSELIYTGNVKLLD